MPEIEFVTPPANTNLTSRATAKLRLRITGTENDLLIDQIIKEASADIVTYCRRPFARASYRERYLDLTSGFTDLIATPLVAIQSITINGSPALGWEIEDSSAGFIRRNSNLLPQANPWWNDSFNPPLWQNATGVVQYTAGYLLPDEGATRNLPYDLESACIDIVKRKYSAARSEAPLTREAVGDLSITYDTAAAADPIPPTAKATLDSCRRTYIA